MIEFIMQPHVIKGTLFLASVFIAVLVIPRIMWWLGGRL